MIGIGKEGVRKSGGDPEYLGYALGILGNGKGAWLATNSGAVPQLVQEEQGSSRTRRLNREKGQGVGSRERKNNVFLWNSSQTVEGYIVNKFFGSIMCVESHST